MEGYYVVFGVNIKEERGMAMKLCKTTKEAKEYIKNCDKEGYYAGYNLMYNFVRKETNLEG